VNARSSVGYVEIGEAEKDDDGRSENDILESCQPRSDICSCRSRCLAILGLEQTVSFWTISDLSLKVQLTMGSGSSCGQLRPQRSLCEWSDRRPAHETSHCIWSDNMSLTGTIIIRHSKAIGLPRSCMLGINCRFG